MAAICSRSARVSGWYPDLGAARVALSSRSGVRDVSATFDLGAGGGRVTFAGGGSLAGGSRFEGAAVESGMLAAKLCDAIATGCTSGNCCAPSSISRGVLGADWLTDGKVSRSRGVLGALLFPPSFSGFGRARRGDSVRDNRFMTCMRRCRLRRLRRYAKPSSRSRQPS